MPRTRSPRIRVVDDGDPRKYWAQIPNIVCDMELPSQVLALYVQIKRACGEDGVCYKSTRTLAKALKVGTGTVVRAKALLEKPWPQIGNRPLIRTTSKPNPQGGKPYDEISVTDIWRANIERFTSANMELDDVEQVPKSAEQVPNTSANMELKKNPLKKNQEEEQRDPLASLKSDPLYEHINVEREFQKAERWAAANHRQMTPRFFVNWLNKIDAPFRPNGNGRTYVDDVWDKALTMDELKAKMEA